MTWVAGWTYRKTVTITGQTGAGIDYQVNFSIGDASGGDFHLENHCTSFPNDIQVTDNDQTTPLDHWVEDLTVDPITIWVEVADDLGNNVDVCVYYGKSGESSASNGTNTFLLFDTFGNIDTDKWTTTGTPTADGELLLNAAGEAMKSQATFTYKAWRSRAKFASPSNTYQAIGFHWTINLSPTNSEMFYCVNPNLNAFSAGASATDTSLGTDSFFGNYHIYDIWWKSGEAKFLIDDVVEHTETTNVCSTAINIILSDSITASTDLYIDWVLVREYNSPEPAFSSVGSEESPPSVTVPVFMHSYRNLRET